MIGSLMLARRTILTLPLLTSLAALSCTELVTSLTKDKSAADAGAVAASSAVSTSPASTAPSDVAASAPTTTAAGPTSPVKAGAASTTSPVKAPAATSPVKVGAASTTSPVKAPVAASKADLDKAFAALDINDDDQLDGIEVKSCGCAVADVNGDGEITRAEYLAAGLAGRIRPGGAPAPASSPTPTSASTSTSAPTSTPTPNHPPAPPQAGGVPPGLYKCAGSVGGTYMTTGRVVILDATRYATGTDGAGQGTYKFFPETGQIVFTSGPNADLATVSYARLVTPTRIQMKTGKNGRSLWDCKR